MNNSHVYLSKLCSRNFTWECNQQVFHTSVMLINIIIIYTNLSLIDILVLMYIYTQREGNIYICTLDTRYVEAVPTKMCELLINKILRPINGN